MNLEPETRNPKPETHASIWPAVLAAGLTAAFFGLIAATWSFGILGVLAMILGIGGWVGELRHAHERP